eukprot:Pompholyxophrys_punicea_v1_NODE_260_length_2503_cov_15.998366.p3 type:complete len:135 gc:universal NODE_260_length_2503_cov_15.998366:1518-1114(-)
MILGCQDTEDSQSQGVFWNLQKNLRIQKIFLRLHHSRVFPFQFRGWKAIQIQAHVRRFQTQKKKFREHQKIHHHKLHENFLVFLSSKEVYFHPRMDFLQKYLQCPQAPTVSLFFFSGPCLHTQLLVLGHHYDRI